MAVWLGINQGLAEKEARKVTAANTALDARRVKLAEDSFLENKKLSRIELLSKYGEGSKENAKTASAKAAQIKRLTVIGLPLDVATYLAKSGEGSEILKTYDKVAPDRRSKVWLSSLIKRVNDYLGDDANAENVAKAFKAGILSGENLSTPGGQAASLMQSIYAATSPESFENIDEQLAEIIAKSSQGTVEPTIPPIGGVTIGMTNSTESQRLAIEKEITRSVSPSFGGFFKGVDTEGNPILNPNLAAVDATEFRGLLDEAVRSVTSGSEGVNATTPRPKLIEDAVRVMIDSAKKLNLSPGTSIKTEKDALDITLPKTNESFSERMKRIEREREGS